ncbi:uracil-DNA glycosylase [Thalassovita aquimarina]|uniref:Type-4 uracil-DNA glycosylase n=1 Tax=Thalassovita aquimarina TaxID=2785917 RepID=A0ABS5HP85_9RHOB|nr:uracil-DNA glycosylase [Thalassovita aquimarina]MBR9650762.1 uracil-DNA glycosylase [Thalassovita aquimarina]
MESALDFHTAKALLEWQIELGADEALCEAPVDRYALEAEKPKAKPKAQAPHPAAVKQAEVDPVSEARAAARSVQDLKALRAAMEAFDHCELKRGARQLVFSDGNPAARVMIIGEAPGRDEDREGRPFVGRAGQLLDRMLAAIGLDRKSDQAESAVYITNVLPWRPPQNRDPKPDEIAMLLPFLERHVALANPDFLILMGNISCQAALGKRGITRLRGQWTEAFGKPAIPMFHPAYLLRTPQAKREAWADLLEIKARLEQPS